MQAIEFNFKELADKSQPEGDRAIALCWLAHLVGDIHQPCHAGSLYVAGVFPDGDRGANSIKTQAGNLHSLWDGLLGRRFDEGDVRRRRMEITGNKESIQVGKMAASEMRPLSWVKGSRQWAEVAVYTPEVLGPVRAVSNGFAENVPAIDLTQDYMQKAGKIAQLRAAMAGYRLAEVWRRALAHEADIRLLKKEQ